jgi:hypothetical protein
MLHIYIWIQHNEIHQTLSEKGGRREGEKEWKYNGGNQLVQSTLYAYMELPQWNPFVLLTQENLQIK